MILSVLNCKKITQKVTTFYVISKCAKPLNFMTFKKILNTYHGHKLIKSVNILHF